MSDETKQSEDSTDLDEIQTRLWNFNGCKDYSLTIVAGSYNIYLKNETLFGDKYIFLQKIDETCFKKCTTEFIDNLYIDSFDNISIKNVDAIAKHWHNQILKYQFATNIIETGNNDKY
eukprot:106844_1